jgi:hypothetical protein
MSNEFYTHTGYPANSEEGRAVSERAELLALQAAFDKMPALAGNQNKLVVVNPSGGALTVMGNGQANVGMTSWTPTITCVTPGNLTIVYAERVGQQYRLGGIVITYFRIRTTTWTHTTASGALILEGMPSSSIALSKGTSGIGFSGFTKAGYTYIQVELVSNAVQAFFEASGSAVGLAQVTVTDFPTAGNVILTGTVIQGG